MVNPGQEEGITGDENGSEELLLDCKPRGSMVGEEDFGEAVQDEASQARLGTMFENIYPRLEPTFLKKPVSPAYGQHCPIGL